MTLTLPVFSRSLHESSHEVMSYKNKLTIIILVYFNLINGIFIWYCKSRTSVINTLQEQVNVSYECWRQHYFSDISLDRDSTSLSITLISPVLLLVVHESINNVMNNQIQHKYYYCSIKKSEQWLHHFLDSSNVWLKCFWNASMYPVDLL